MMENNLTDKDKEKLVSFLNFVSANAKFKLKTDEIIKYFHLLAYMQKELLPKIESNILEIKRVIKPKEKE